MRVLDPKRKQYQRKFSDEGECVFCSGREVLECAGLATGSWKVIVNRFPYMDGNVIIIPKRHVENTGELTGDEWVEFGSILDKTLKTLSGVFGVKSFNVGMNLGLESGASIPHIHWQVVPRKFKNITVMNTFADLYLVAVTPEETRTMIEEYLEKQ